MISIIICSRSRTIESNLERNIDETIGEPYEIICIDNSKRQYGICSAYNEGVRRAKGEYLCFMHEDISFLSKDWGKLGIRHFSNPEIGMVGVLGCTYYDECMTYWCHSPFCVGHNWCGSWHKIFKEPLKSENIVASDGLWLLIRRELFDGAISWDEYTFPGFDMYDLDISMQILKSNKEIVIEPDICINHKSNGNFSIRFYQSAKDFHKKWDYFLPVSANKDNSQFSKLSKQYAFQKICRLNIENNYAIVCREKWYNTRLRRLLAAVKNETLKILRKVSVSLKSLSTR